MFKRFLLCVLLLLSSSIYAACELIDDTGTKVELKNSAERIISLAPDITETLFAIGAGKQIVGVIDASDYPDAAKTIPKVGSYSGIDLEKIMTLHPDLIITWGNNFSRQLSNLSELSVAIYKSDPHQLDDISRRFKHLGCLTGHEATANTLAESFDNRLNDLKQKYSNKKSITVFYQIGTHTLMTINKESWINQVISLCGGRNLFADAKTTAPEITLEAIVIANPRAIINSTLDANWKRTWETWKQIDAVKNSSLFTIHPDLLERAGPRLLVGANELCQDLERVRYIT